MISHDGEENGMIGIEHEYNLQRPEERVINSNKRGCQGTLTVLIFTHTTVTHGFFITLNPPQSPF